MRPTRKRKRRKTTTTAMTKTKTTTPPPPRTATAPPTKMMMMMLMAAAVARNLVVILLGGRALLTRLALARAAATSARRNRETELTTEERNELRLQGAVAQLRASGLSDEACGSADDSRTTAATDGAGRALLLQKVQRALAQVNSHIRKQAAGREHRFNAQHLMFGVETANGPASFAVRDVVAMVCVARHGRQIVHYTDYGAIEEITVASQRGTADHDRARVVSRRTTGAMVRLHFFRRVPAVEDGSNNNARRSLLGRSYATTADGRELLTYAPTEAQVQNRWKVEALLCRVSVERTGNEQHVPVLASQRCVDSIVSDLNGGASIENAIANGLALPAPAQ